MDARAQTRSEDLPDRFDAFPLRTTLSAVDKPEDAGGADPLIVEIDAATAVAAARLDPARASAGPETPERRPVPSRQRWLPFGLIGSIAIHLLPLLALVEWRAAPAEIAPPIPVHLVVVEPPPPPAPAPQPKVPKPEKKPPAPRSVASEDIGDTTAKPSDRGPASAEPQKTDPKPAPAPRQMVSALPPPPPPSPSEVALPVPTDQAEAPAQLPIPVPKPKPPPMPVVHRGMVPRQLAHFGRIPGPAATRDEYFAYCESLIRRNFYMLPRGFQGSGIFKLMVMDDGRIAAVETARSSGFHEVDDRVKQMIAAVGRFPPLPQWFQGQVMQMQYDFVYSGASSPR